MLTPLQLTALRAVHRVALAAAFTVLACLPAAAQLTDPQMATLKAAILADPSLNAIPATYPEGAVQLASALNATASPDFIVWKSTVSIAEVGQAINGTELAGLTSLNNTRLQTLAVYLSGGVNPARANHRQFFDDVFSGAGGVSSRAALLALWKRSARVVEKVFATGTGSDASPATLVYEGTISAIDAHNARVSGQ